MILANSIVHLRRWFKIVPSIARESFLGKTNQCLSLFEQAKLQKPPENTKFKG